VTLDEGEDPPTSKYQAVSDDGPTGKQKPVNDVASSAKSRKLSAPREAVTVPAPPDGPMRKAGDAPPRIFTRGGVTPVSSAGDAACDAAASAAGLQWKSILDDDAIDDAGPSIEADPPMAAPKPRTGATPPPGFGRPSAEQPSQSLTTTARGTGVAPLPPRLPTLGPEPEFSFGLESPPAPEKPAEERRNLDPRMPSADDLSWSPSGVSEPTTGRVGASKPLPSAIPLPLDPLGAEVQALVERASGFPPGFEPPDPRREMHERLALGDFTGALSIAEAVLSDAPDDADAIGVADECRGRLKHMYISRLGGLGLVPVMIVPRTELKWLSLDHRAGFLLSLFDGHVTLEEVLDLAGMPQLEVLRTLWELLSQRVIELRKPK
jgi:hypothetical protein